MELEEDKRIQTRVNVKKENVRRKTVSMSACFNSESKITYQVTALTVAVQSIY